MTANEIIEEIKATFDMEDMLLTQEEIEELKDIELAKTSTEAVRQKILADIKQRHQNLQT